MTLTHKSPKWGTDTEVAKRIAIAHFDLRGLGWKGFDQLDWTKYLLEKYPSIPVILIACNIGNPASFVALEALAKEMSEDDRRMLRDYVIGKLGLEELSCHRSGPAAGSCDRRAALERCAKLSFEWN